MKVYFLWGSEDEGFRFPLGANKGYLSVHEAIKVAENCLVEQDVPTDQWLKGAWEKTSPPNTHGEVYLTYLWSEGGIEQVKLNDESFTSLEELAKHEYASAVDWIFIVEVEIEIS